MLWVFVIRFWPKFFYMGKEATYWRRQPNCTYHCRWQKLGPFCGMEVCAKMFRKTKVNGWHYCTRLFKLGQGDLTTESIRNSKIDFRLSGKSLISIIKIWFNPKLLHFAIFFSFTCCHTLLIQTLHEIFICFGFIFILIAQDIKSI